MLTEHAEEAATPVSRVRLPVGARPPFEVFVNGVSQSDGADYRVAGDTLVFDRHLEKEGRLGFWRWLSMALNIAGTYRQNDSVDVMYTRDGKRRFATALDIESDEVRDGGAQARR